MNLNNVANSVSTPIIIRLDNPANRSSSAAEIAHNAQKDHDSLTVLSNAAMIHGTSSKTADDLQIDNHHVVENTSNSFTHQMSSTVNSFNTEDKAYPLTQSSKIIKKKQVRDRYLICNFIHPVTNKCCDKSFSSKSNVKRHQTSPHWEEILSLR